MKGIRIFQTFTILTLFLVLPSSSVLQAALALDKIGTNADEHLVGTEGHDYISGQGGDDFIEGLAGPDNLFGRDGNDTIDAGRGHDKLSGAKGDDHLIGGLGDDVLTGGLGADFFDCGQGNDTIIGFLQAEGDTKTDDCEIIVAQGLTLSEVVAAFHDQSTRESKGLENILVFLKSGGSIDIGNFNPNLRVDIPAEAGSEEQVSFQYFVEVKNDLTGPGIAHCSDVRLHIYVDEQKIYVTDWMGYDGRSPELPLQTGKITINNISTGDHELGLIPEGRLSGCNDEDYVLSWGGTVAVFQ